MKPTLLKRGAPIAALGATALLAAGCGSSTTKPAASAAAPGSTVGSAAIARAADVSGAAKGEKIAYALTEQLPSIGKLTVSGTGAFDNTPKQGETTLNISAPNASSLGGEGALLSNLNLTLALSGQDLYLKLPSSLESLIGSFTQNKPWVSLNLADLAKTSGIPGLSTVLNGQTNPTDPAAELKEFEEATTDGVHQAGTATVAGVQTTEYTGSLDLGKLAADLPSSVRSLAKQGLAKLAKQSGTTSLPFEIWIDSANLVRKVELNFSSDANGSKSAVSFVTTFLAYGTQPAPTVPAASETFPLNGLLSKLGTGSSSSSGGSFGSF